MSRLPPLQFHPLFKRYLWGGRRLNTLLDKPIGQQEAAESWEIVDHGDDQSVVLSGPLKGNPLGRLVRQQGEALLGRHAPQTRFPLLLKYLDAQRTLSVQVHPNDEQAARLDPPDLGKTEAWVVLAAEPGAKIYAGLKRGVGRSALAQALETGTCETCLHAFEPHVGDCVFIRAGTVHALGEGLVIAEIQQASDTTFRLFDWNRVDKQGRSRPLHVQQSLEATDYECGPVSPQTPCLTAPGVGRLVECEKFILERRTAEAEPHFEEEGRFHLITIPKGAAELTVGQESVKLGRGKTALLPARRDQTTLKLLEGSLALDMFLP